MGVEGATLTAAEEEFFRLKQPLGFILMGRNIKNKKQVRDLVHALKRALGNDRAPILVDQEGGRVARLKAPTWYHPTAAAIFGKIAEISLKDAKRAVEINSTLIARDLIELGINVNATPVLDIPAPNSHTVIGDRAFSANKTVVAELGRVVCNTLSKYKVVPVIKHIPGHGRAEADSHLELPTVNASLSALKKIDFYPFKALSKSTHWAMTAHVLYTSLDRNACATFSKKVVTAIRQDIGFNGLLVTDCITMQALSGSIGERAKRAIDAGCDIVLHSRYRPKALCGSLADLQTVIDSVPLINSKQAQLLEASLSSPSAVIKDFDQLSIITELQNILQTYGHASVISGSDPTER